MLVALWEGDLWSEYASNGSSSSTHHVTCPLRIVPTSRCVHRTLITPPDSNLDATNPNGILSTRLSGPYRNAYVLVVDDHIESRRVLARMIGACGVNVGTCGGAEDALIFIDKLL